MIQAVDVIIQAGPFPTRSPKSIPIDLRLSPTVFYSGRSIAILHRVDSATSHVAHILDVTLRLLTERYSCFP